MSHSESQWRAEIQAHAPRGCDLVALAEQVPDLEEWRFLIAEDPESRECLEMWEAHLRENALAVPLEQATEDGAVEDLRFVRERLRGCPAEFAAPVFAFLEEAPTEIRDYLVYRCHCLVPIERERRTGSAHWRSEAPSGSPEVLSELMFKWGPRFSRHRWTW